MAVKIAKGKGYGFDGSVGTTSGDVSVFFQSNHNAKAVAFDVHPIHTLVASAHEDGSVAVWDYGERQSTLANINIISLMEERGKTRKGKTTILSSSSSINISKIMFVDSETRGSKLTKYRKYSNAVVNGSPTNSPHQTAPASAEDKDRSISSSQILDIARFRPLSTHLAVLVNGIVLIIDYTQQTYDCIEINCADFELNTKTPVVINSFSFTDAIQLHSKSSGSAINSSANILFAIGCSDGCARFVDISKDGKALLSGTINTNTHKIIDHIWIGGYNELSEENGNYDLVLITGSPEGKITWYSLKWAGEGAEKGRETSGGISHSVSTHSLSPMASHNVSSASMASSDSFNEPPLTNRSQRRTTHDASSPDEKIDAFFPYSIIEQAFASHSFSGEILSFSQYRTAANLNLNGVSAGRLVCSGSDRSIAIFDLFGGQEILKLKMNKQVIIKTALCSHPRFPLQSIYCLWKDDSKLYLLDPSSPEFQMEVLDSNDFPNSGKKNKLYDVMPHPTNPSILFVSTRNQLTALKIDWFTSPACAVSGYGRSGLRESKRKLLYYAFDDHLHVISLRQNQKQSFKLMLVNSGKGRLLCDVSPNGRFLCVRSSKINSTITTGRYIVFDLASRDKKDKEIYQVIDEGSCIDFCFFSGANGKTRFAVMHIPVKTGDSTPTTKKKKEKLKKSEEKDASASNTNITIKEITDSDNKCVCNVVIEDFITKIPVLGLQGGLLLSLLHEPDFAGLNQNNTIDVRKLNRGGSLSIKAKNSADFQNKLHANTKAMNKGNRGSMPIVGTASIKGPSTAAPSGQGIGAGTGPKDTLSPPPGGVGGGPNTTASTSASSFVVSAPSSANNQQSSGSSGVTPSSAHSLTSQGVISFTQSGSGFNTPASSAPNTPLNPATGSSFVHALPGIHSPTLSYDALFDVESSPLPTLSNSVSMYGFLDGSLKEVIGDLYNAVIVCFSPNEKMLLLSYDSYFVVYNLRPFYFIGRWNYSITSCLFVDKSSMLVFATHSHVYLLFPQSREYPPIPVASVSAVEAASLHAVLCQSTCSVPHSHDPSCPSACPSFLAHVKPSGPVKILKADEETIVVVDSNYQYSVLPTSSNYLKFHIFSSSDMIEDALNIAKICDPIHSVVFARFLCLLCYPQVAASLPYLPDRIKWDLCKLYNLFDVSLKLIPTLSSFISNTDEIISDCIQLAQQAEESGNTILNEKILILLAQYYQGDCFKFLAIYYAAHKQTSKLQDLYNTLSHLPNQQKFVAFLLEDEGSIKNSLSNNPVAMAEFLLSRSHLLDDDVMKNYIQEVNRIQRQYFRTIHNNGDSRPNKI